MQQKRDSLASAHSNALVLQQWTLKQTLSFSVCPSRLHICKDTDAKQMHSALHRIFFQSSIRMGSL